MNPSIRCIAIAATFVATVCRGVVPANEKPKPQPLDGEIKWVFEYEDGKRLSRESGKPMFVVFRCER